MIIDALSVAAVYFGFIAVGFGVAAVVRVLFPKWWEGAQDDE